MQLLKCIYNHTHTPSWIYIERAAPQLSVSFLFSLKLTIFTLQLYFTCHTLFGKMCFPWCFWAPQCAEMVTEVIKCADITTRPALDFTCTGSKTGLQHLALFWSLNWLCCFEHNREVANVYFIVHCRLLNSNSLTTVRDDAFSGLPHLEYL